MNAMFWVALGLFAGSAYLLFRQIHRRRWALTAIAGGGVALSLTAVAAQTWFSIIDWEIARAGRLRHFGQAKVALDLGQPAQDRKQVLAIAALVFSKPVHRGGQPSQLLHDLVGGLPRKPKVRQVAKQLLCGLAQQPALTFRAPGARPSAPMAVRAAHRRQS